MKGLVYLTWRHLAYRPGRALLLAACLAVALLLPTVTRVLSSGFESALVERADTTPIVVGAAGPPLDLVLAGLYFARSELGGLSTGTWRRIAAREDLLAVPLVVQFTARKSPLVATTPEYFEERGLLAQVGRLPFVAGEVVLGSEFARRHALSTGDTLFSDPVDSLDLSKPPALKLAVTGVLRARGTADDRAAFVTLETAWALHGLAHGHDDVTVESVDPSLVLGADEEELRLSPAFVTYFELTPQNLATFHLHDDPDQLPLSCVLVFPRTDRAGTMLRAETNTERVFGPLQAVDARAQFDELLALVLGLRRLLDGIAIVLFAATATLGALVLGLSMELRAAEVRTLDRLGSSARTVALLHTFELATIGAVALLVSGAVLGALLLFDPDLTVFL
jgi:putative ABC transport system permease protein